MAMPAHARFRTTLAALGFAAAMLVLGLLNPHAVVGHAGCGLVCEAQVAAPLAGLHAD
jgi:hypothetical protein